MKIGSLIQHRVEECRDDWGVGLIVDHCEAGSCGRRVRTVAHSVIHFPNRKYKAATAEFIHATVSKGLDEDNLKWVVI